MEFYFKVALTIVAGLLILHTITANLMVIIAFKINKQLHTLCNYCLVSLAISDLIVGILLMSVFTVYLFIGYWPLGAFLCDLWLSLDYGVCTASILNLLVIAVDRLLSVSRPLTYRRTPTKMGLMIAGAWVVSGIIWAPWIFAWPYIDGVRIVPEKECFIQVLVTNPIMATILSCCSFFIPVIVTTVIYSILYQKTQQRILRKKALQTRFTVENELRNSFLYTDSQTIPRSGTSIILALIKAICCCFVCAPRTDSDIKDDNDRRASPSNDSGIACCSDNEWRKESLSQKLHDTIDTRGGGIPNIACISGVATFNNEKEQKTTNTLYIDTVDIDAKDKQVNLPENASINDFDSAGLELENAVSIQGDLNSQEREIAASVMTLRNKRQQQYNDRKMLTILSATLLSLTISFAPYYTTAIIESFYPGFLNVVAANICKYALFSQICFCRLNVETFYGNAFSKSEEFAY